MNGFLTAAAAIGDQQQVARAVPDTPGGQELEPILERVRLQDRALRSETAVSATRDRRAAARATPRSASRRRSGRGSWSTATSQRACPGAKPTRSPRPPPPVNQQVFQLVKTDDQWRISSAPSALLLTQGQFADDYELRNLYFFDPSNSYLVPDPVYVPLQALTTSLMNRLVNDLISPPKDWLAEAAQTAFPAGTKIIGGVTLSGTTAAVDLGGAIATAPNQTTLLAQVSAQLLWTLISPGQGGSQVQSVELLVNGQPKYPPRNSQGIAVQHQSEASYQPATGASSASTTSTARATCAAARGWMASRCRSPRSAPGTRRSPSPQTASTWPPCATDRCTSGRSRARWQNARAPVTRRSAGTRRTTCGRRTAVRSSRSGPARAQTARRRDRSPPTCRPPMAG